MEGVFAHFTLPSSAKMTASVKVPPQSTETEYPTREPWPSENFKAYRGSLAGQFLLQDPEGTNQSKPSAEVSWPSWWSTSRESSILRNVIYRYNTIGTEENRVVNTYPKWTDHHYGQTEESAN